MMSNLGKERGCHGIRPNRTLYNNQANRTFHEGFCNVGTGQADTFSNEKDGMSRKVFVLGCRSL